MEYTVYHIYQNGECIYPCLKEREFEVRMAELHGLENITYEKLPPGMGGVGGWWKEPAGDDSY